MEQYLEIVDRIMREGELTPNRTEYDTLAIPSAQFQHDMTDGFPLLTTKAMPFHLIASELEFFVKGLTDKRWLQERGNHIWDKWCRRDKVPYGHDEETKKRMREEPDLGPIYGWQWRHWGADYVDHETDYEGQGIDQLEQVVNMLHDGSYSRRMRVEAWNVEDLPKMALPPCHDDWKVDRIGDTLHLAWSQRSVDTMVGLPFNIASYGLLLHLLSEESGLEPGTLTGNLSNVHIYEPHFENTRVQLERDPIRYALPEIGTSDFSSIFDWEYTDSGVMDYESYDRLKFEVVG